MVITGDTGGTLKGTSIGLPRPLPYILMDIKAAVDPTGLLLTDWNIAQSVQPCAAYSGQPVGRLGYGQAWSHVTCLDQYVAPSATRKTILGGGADLYLNGLYLTGTLPMALQELRTSQLIYLYNNRLTGTLPAWCAAVCLCSCGEEEARIHNICADSSRSLLRRRSGDGTPSLSRRGSFSFTTAPSPPPPSPLPPLSTFPPITTSLALYLPFDNSAEDQRLPVASSAVVYGGQPAFDGGVKSMLGAAASFAAAAGTPAPNGVAGRPAWSVAAPVAVGTTAATFVVSLTAWLLPDPNLRGVWQTPLMLFGGTYGATCTQGIQVDLYPPFTTGINLTVTVNTNNPVLSIAPVQMPAQPGQWLFLGITHDVANQVIKVYGGAASSPGGVVTVTQVGQVSFWTSVALTTPTLIVGGSCDGTRGYTGLVDEVRVYPRVLTFSEMQGAAAFGAAAAAVPIPPPPQGGAPPTGFCSSTAHYWPLSRAAANGTTMPDLGGWGGVGLATPWGATISGVPNFSQPAALGGRDAMEFDGTTSYLSSFVSVASAATYGGAMSFAWWARADKLAAGSRCVV